MYMSAPMSGGVEDFTYACGTGTGSVVTVLTLLGKVSEKRPGGYDRRYPVY